MADRFSVNQNVQIGLEVTPGTAVTATKLLESVNLESGIKYESKQYRAIGRKYDAAVVPGREYTESKLSGDVTYTETIYPLAAMFGAVTPTSVGTLAKGWTWTPALSGSYTPQTLTVEQGDSVRAHKFAYGHVSALGFKFARDAVTLSGTLIGQQISDGISMSTGCTSVGIIPVLGQHVNVYMDSTSGGIGTTALTNVMEADFNISDVYGQFWPLVRANNSFSQKVDKAPKVEAKLLLEADSVGMGLLPNARGGTTNYFRIQAQGATIDTTPSNTYYLFQIDFAGKVSAVAPYADKDGIYAIEYTFDIVEDQTWTKAFAITVQNTLTAL